MTAASSHPSDQAILVGEGGGKMKEKGGTVGGTSSSESIQLPPEFG